MSYSATARAPVAQWIERLVADQEATGSSPVGRTTNSLLYQEKTGPPMRATSLFGVITSPLLHGRGYERDYYRTARWRREPDEEDHEDYALSGGGFAVLAPYHSARAGYLAKIPVDYSQRKMKISRAQMIEYSATDRVKLSYHLDGFVHFSSENPGKIFSGRDPETGIPKGMGIVINKLTNPIRTGPTFGITVWGLDDFDTLRARDEKDAQIFTADDLYHGVWDHAGWNAYQISAFILTPEDWAGVRMREGKYILTRASPAYDAHYAVLELRVVPLGDQPVFLGILANRQTVEFKSLSGFVLGGPSDMKYALMAMYPPPMDDVPNKSLDYHANSTEDAPANGNPE